jgi:ribose-phosphate pyrophosphokinase
MELTLNLAYLDKSDIKYVKKLYPDGQQDLVLLDTENLVGTGVIIKTRLTSFLDVEILLCAMSILDDLEIEYSLKVVYLLGARSDRRFEVGGTNYLQNVIGFVLRLCDTIVLDLHNPKEIDCDWYTSRSLLVDAAVAVGGFEGKMLIYPDKGSVTRIQEQFRENTFAEEVFCLKQRNSEGKLVETIIPKEDFKGSDIVIVDDIGDGFGTFINLAKELQKRNVGKMYLIVTHTIQEQGVKTALQYFDKIFTTNSYKDFNIDNLHVTEVI